MSPLPRGIDPEESALGVVQTTFPTAGSVKISPKTDRSIKRRKSILEVK
jgi:hypothetical protein